MTLALTACTNDAPVVAEDQRLSWSALVKDGLDPEDDLAVFVSSFEDASSPASHLGIVETDGSVDILTTDLHSGGVLAGGGGVLCATTASETLRILSDSAERWTREGYEGSGHWSGTREDGTCVVVLNSGASDAGYETDVHWRQDDEEKRSVVPAVPGPAGQSEDSIWVRDGSITEIPGTFSLYRTNHRTGDTTVEMTWPTRVETRETGEAIHFGDGFGSDLFWHANRLHYIEDLIAGDKTGTQTEIRPGISAQIRLASIDPTRKSYKSTLLAESPTGLLGGKNPGEAGNMASTGMRRGHLFKGGIYIANGSGEILRVDLKSRKMATVGHLSETAVNASEAVAAWHDHRLTLVLRSNGGVFREDYDLRADLPPKRTQLNGLEDLLGDANYLSSAALIK